MDVIINQSNVPDLLNTASKVKISQFKWMNKGKRLVALNGNTSVSLSEAKEEFCVPLNIDYQLRGVSNSKDNDDGISAEYFGSILIAVQKDTLDFSNTDNYFFTFDGNTSLINKDYQNIYVANRVQFLTLEGKTPNISLNSKENTLVLLTPISSLASFQNAKLDFIFEDLTDVSKITKIEMIIPKYSLPQTITAKGIIGEDISSDLDFEIKLKDGVLGYAEFAVDQANEKIVLYSPWAARTFTLPYDVAQKFLSPQGTSLKTLYDLNDGIHKKLYRALMTAIILTSEYQNGFNSFARDTNGNLDKDCEINGIKLRGLENKQSVISITNGLLLATKEATDLDIYKITYEIINMLSAIIESDFSTGSGNNQLNQYLDPFYFITRTQIAVDTGSDKKKVNDTSLEQDLKVSLASKYYSFKENIITDGSTTKTEYQLVLVDDFNSVSLLPSISAGTQYRNPIITDNVSSQNITTNPSERKSGSNAFPRMLFAVDDPKKLEIFFSKKDTQIIATGRSSIQTKSLFWNEDNFLSERDAPHPTPPQSFLPFINPLWVQTFTSFWQPITWTSSKKTANKEQITIEKMKSWVSIFRDHIPFFKQDFDSIENLEKIIAPFLPNGTKIYENGGIKDITIKVVSGTFSTGSGHLSEYITQIKNLELQIEYTYIPINPQSSEIKQSKLLLNGILDKTSWRNWTNINRSSDFRFELVKSELLGEVDIKAISSLVVRGLWIDWITLLITYQDKAGVEKTFTINQLRTDAINDETIAVIKLLLNLGTLPQ